MWLIRMMANFNPFAFELELNSKLIFFAQNSASTCVCLDMCYNQANQLTPSCQANELQHSVRTFGSPTWQALPRVVVNLLTLPNHCNVDGLRKEETSCNNVCGLRSLSFHSRASPRVNIHKEASGLDNVSISTSKNRFITFTQFIKKYIHISSHSGDVNWNFPFGKKWFFSSWELSSPHPSLVSASLFTFILPFLFFPTNLLLSCLLLCFSSFLQRTDGRRWIVWDSNIDGGFDLRRLLKLVPNQSTVRSLWPSCPSFFPVSTSLPISWQSPFISLSISIFSSHLFFPNY